MSATIPSDATIPPIGNPHSNGVANSSASVLDEVDGQPDHQLDRQHEERDHLDPPHRLALKMVRDLILPEPPPANLPRSW